MKDRTERDLTPKIIKLNFNKQKYWRNKQMIHKTGKRQFSITIYL